ncbi:hypothetical protein SCUP234_09160 [Seiridium cupressi]
MSLKYPAKEAIISGPSRKRAPVESDGCLHNSEHDGMEGSVGRRRKQSGADFCPPDQSKELESQSSPSPKNPAGQGLPCPPEVFGPQMVRHGAQNAEACLQLDCDALVLRQSQDADTTSDGQKDSLAPGKATSLNAPAAKHTVHAFHAKGFTAHLIGSCGQSVGALLISVGRFSPSSLPPGKAERTRSRTSASHQNW